MFETLEQPIKSLIAISNSVCWRSNTDDLYITCIFTFITETKGQTSLTQTSSTGNIEDCLMEYRCLGLFYVRFSELILKDASN